MRRLAARAGLLFALSFALMGCVFNKVRQDSKARAVNGQVYGKVDVRDWNDTPLFVAAGRLPGEGEHPVMVVTRFTLREPGFYEFYLRPGAYVVGAVEDTNGNGRFDDGERGVLGHKIQVGKGTRTRIDLVVREVFKGRERLDEYTLVDESRLARGDVLSLDNRKFAKEVGVKGLWSPVAHVNEEHAGIYMLQPFEEGKTPVLFVHGMMGYPQEMRKLIERLDRKRFQPWVLLYPSGLELSTTGRVTNVILNELYSRHEFESMCVVAYSMGGLVARSFLKYHTSGESPHRIRGFATLASPLGGMRSASFGVKMAPEVVQSWYDLDPASEFLRKLYETPLSDEVEYHLLFGFDDRGSSDGVVPLTSQLRTHAQNEAENVRGFRATHHGILYSDAAAAQVLAMLDRCRGDGGPLSAPRPPEPEVVDEPRR